MNNITANVKAFMRPKQVDNCIRFLYNAEINKILVGYDGPEYLYQKHKDIIKKWKDKGIDIELIRFQYNYGLSAVRNRLAEHTDTKYIMLLDDDNYIPKSAPEMNKFLELNKDYGAVAMGWVTPQGYLDIDAYDIKIEDNYCVRYYDFDNKQSIAINDMFFVYPFTFIPNQALYRKKVFDEVQWDENYIINREHEDFMLMVRYNTKWKFAISPTLFTIHDQVRSDEMQKIRKGKEYRKSIRYFLKKWNIKGIYPPSYYVRYLSGKREEFIIKESHKLGLKKLSLNNVYFQ